MPQGTSCKDKSQHQVPFSVTYLSQSDHAPRLRVVSNFGDGDCGVREIHTRVREVSRRCDVTKGAPALPSHYVASKFRACTCVYFARPTIAIAKIRDYSQSSMPPSQHWLLYNQWMVTKNMNR